MHKKTLNAGKLKLWLSNTNLGMFNEKLNTLCSVGPAVVSSVGKGSVSVESR